MTKAKVDLEKELRIPAQALVQDVTNDLGPHIETGVIRRPDENYGVPVSTVRPNLPGELLIV